jgi:TorA maturation chaperone TorD
MTAVETVVTTEAQTLVLQAHTPDLEVAPEDALRAQLYGLLAHFLARAPEQSALDIAAGMTGDDTDLGQAVKTFAKIAGKSEGAAIAQEYHDLFIGLGRGELLPYGSYYLTGFLHEKPLARLRLDMERLNITRRETVSEPEDHVAALMEMMAGLITGAFGAAASLDEQKQFFDAHLGSWAPHFFGDLETAESSVFYAAIGTMGKQFLEIEKAAFDMD